LSRYRNAGPQAGFTSGDPWLPVDAGDSGTVETQCGDPDSLLSLYRRLIALRHEEPVLAAGTYEPVDATGNVLAYRRRLGARTMLIILNMEGTRQAFTPAGPGTIYLSTHLDRRGERVSGTVALRPHEGLMIDM
jgi:alpha-glucosidase